MDKIYITPDQLKDPSAIQHWRHVPKHIVEGSRQRQQELDAALEVEELPDRGEGEEAMCVHAFLWDGGRTATAAHLALLRVWSFRLLLVPWLC